MRTHTHTRMRARAHTHTHTDLINSEERGVAVGRDKSRSEGRRREGDMGVCERKERGQ